MSRGVREHDRSQCLLSQRRSRHDRRTTFRHELLVQRRDLCGWQQVETADFQATESICLDRRAILVLQIRLTDRRQARRTPGCVSRARITTVVRIGVLAASCRAAATTTPPPPPPPSPPPPPPTLTVQLGSPGRHVPLPVPSACAGVDATTRSRTNVIVTRPASQPNRRAVVTLCMSYWCPGEQPRDANCRCARPSSTSSCRGAVASWPPRGQASRSPLCIGRTDRSSPPADNW